MGTKNQHNTIIEVDLPESFLKKYLGIGIYGMDERINLEFRIPYIDLYRLLAKNPEDYFFKAIRYYNKNLNRFYLDSKWGYKKIEALLKEVPYEGIHQVNRLSIYPLFCFEPTKVFSIRQEDIGLPRIDEVLRQVEITREKRHIVNRIEFFKHNWDNQALFDKTIHLIEEENEAMKRILAKK